MQRRCPFTAHVIVCLFLIAPVAGARSFAIDEKPADDAVTLEQSMTIEIRSTSDATIRYSERTQTLTRNGVDSFATAEVVVNPWISLREFSGAVTSPDGKRTEIKKQQVFETSMGNDELYNEFRKKVLAFPAVVPGATIEYQYEISVRSLFFLPTVFSLQEPIPVHLKTLIVQVPTSMPIRFSVLHAAPEYTHDEKNGIVTHRWVVRDMPALKSEPFMPPWRDVLPHIEIVPEEVVLQDHRIDSSSWNGIAAWEWELAHDRVVPTPEVQQKAQQLTVGGLDAATRTRRLFEFVQQKINYVNIYLGIGGWQPHPSADVLRHRYGDCKDKATLLIAMLRSIGLQGYPALIMTRDFGLIDRNAPYPSFNHQIVAVPKEGGGYNFLDPTAEGTSYGEVPWQDQGVPVLVVREDGRGELLDIPLAPPEKNRMHVRVEAQLKATGDLEGTYQIQGYGERRDLFAAILSAKSSEREEALADLIGWLSPGARMLSQEIKVPPDPESPATAILRFSVTRFTIRAGTREVISPFLVRFKGLRTATAYPERSLPVLFRSLRNDTCEVRLQLPPGRVVKKLPADHNFTGPGVTASTHFETGVDEDHQVIVLRRSMTMSLREIGAQDYAALRTFASSLAEEESGALTLESQPIAQAALPPSAP